MPMTRVENTNGTMMDFTIGRNIDEDNRPIYSLLNVGRNIPNMPPTIVNIRIHPNYERIQGLGLDACC